MLPVSKQCVCLTSWSLKGWCLWPRGNIWGAARSQGIAHSGSSVGWRNLDLRVDPTILLQSLQIPCDEVYCNTAWKPFSSVFQPPHVGSAYSASPLDASPEPSENPKDELLMSLQICLDPGHSSRRPLCTWQKLNWSVAPTALHDPWTVSAGPLRRSLTLHGKKNSLLYLLTALTAGSASWHYHFPELPIYPRHKQSIFPYFAE